MPIGRIDGVAGETAGAGDERPGERAQITTQPEADRQKGRPVLLVAYDGSPMSEVQLHMACRSADDIDGIVRVLHVIELPWQIPISAAVSAEEQASAATLFDRAERIAAHYKVLCESVLSKAHSVSEVVIAEARESQAKMIFIGLRDRRRRGTSIFLSRTLRRLLQEAPCPVQIGYLPADLPESLALADELVTEHAQ